MFARVETAIFCPKCLLRGTIVSTSMRAMPTSYNQDPRRIYELSAGFSAVELRTRFQPRLECSTCKVPVKER